MSNSGGGDSRNVWSSKNKVSPISLSGSEGEMDELLEIKPPQPNVRKHSNRYPEKRHKHASNRHEYAQSSGTHYKQASFYNRQEPLKKYYRDKYEPNNRSKDSSYNEYNKRKDHRTQHRKERELHKETKTREDRYIQEEEQALKEEIKRKERELHAKLEKRRHQRDQEREYRKDKYLKSERMDVDERHKKNDDKSRLQDSLTGIKSTVMVVSDDSLHSPPILASSAAEDLITLSITPLSTSSISSDYHEHNNEREVKIIEDDTREQEEEDANHEDISEEESEQESSSAQEDEEEEEEEDDSSSAEEASSSGEDEDEEEDEENQDEDTSSDVVDVSADEEVEPKQDIKKQDKSKKQSKRESSHRKKRRHSSDGDDEEQSEVKKDVEINLSDEDNKKDKIVKIPPKPIDYFPSLQGCRSVEQFHCLNKIEEGTYGIVYRARDKRTNKIVALKRLKMEKEKEGFPITSLREINTLLKAQHPNIVTVREIVVGSNMDKIFIVMDYVEHDLKSLMETMKQKKSSFMTSEVKCLMQQLLNAVAHLHDNWILHRDLKTSNLLFSHQGILKVGDFGLAREYGSPLRHYTSVVVTLWYRAPELLLGTKLYSTPIDMWSIGCIFAEFLAMEPLLPGKSEVDQLNRIFKALGTPTEEHWPDYKKLPVLQKVTFAQYPPNSLRHKFKAHILSDVGLDLLNRLLTFNPSKRITAEEALEHEYFKEHPLATDPSMFPTWPAKSEPGSGYNKLKMESPKAPSGGKGHKELMDDDGFFMGGRERNVLSSQNMAAFESTFSLKF